MNLLRGTLIRAVPEHGTRRFMGLDGYAVITDDFDGSSAFIYWINGHPNMEYDMVRPASFVAPGKMFEIVAGPEELPDDFVMPPKWGDVMTGDFTGDSWSDGTGFK